MPFYWIYFLDDSSAKWLETMPKGAALQMNKGGRDFIIAEEFEAETAAYNCTTNVIEDAAHLDRLMKED